MMLHVAQLWEVIIKNHISASERKTLIKAGNYPHFKVDQINIKKEKHSEKNNQCKKKKKKSSYDKMTKGYMEHFLLWLLNQK